MLPANPLPSFPICAGPKNLTDVLVQPAQPEQRLLGFGDLARTRLAAQFPASVLDGATVELFDLRDERSSRFVHAKAFIACGKEWDHVISGSMNCSLPALLGPTIPRGNAELGLYKRVEPGMALFALKLDGYRQTPLDRDEILPRLNERFTVRLALDPIPHP